jgi:nucleoside-diphosphate-sugar epimerase
MKVLVTGADGFIGSHLCEALVSEGHDVTALCFYNALDHHGHLDAIEIPGDTDIQVLRGDITDPWYMMAAFTENKPEVIYHLAAHNSVPHSFLSSHSHLMTNVIGTHNVLRAAELIDAKTILMSSSEVYGSAQSEIMDIDHVVSPQSPYAASKLAADFLGHAFLHTYEQEVVIARSFNVFGPRQSARAVIPQIICQALDPTEKVIRLGNLTAARDWVFVSDLTGGLIAAAGLQSGLVQFATGKSYQILEVANMVCDIIGVKKLVAEEEGRLRPENAEVDRLTGSYRTAKEKLGWKPTVRFRDGLVRTIEWYKALGFEGCEYFE